MGKLGIAITPYVSLLPDVLQGEFVALKTYREIFEKIEVDYFKGTNQNTKGKRDRFLTNNVTRYNG